MPTYAENAKEKRYEEVKYATVLGSNLATARLVLAHQYHFTVKWRRLGEYFHI
jgi:hypothetical protein